MGQTNSAFATCLAACRLCVGLHQGHLHTMFSMGLAPPNPKHIIVGWGACSHGRRVCNPDVLPGPGLPKPMQTPHLARACDHAKASALIRSPSALCLCLVPVRAQCKCLGKGVLVLISVRNQIPGSPGSHLPANLLAMTVPEPREIIGNSPESQDSGFRGRTAGQFHTQQYGCPSYSQPFGHKDL